MFDSAWLTLRQAQEALKNGRLEDALRLLGRPSVQGHKRSWELLRQLAEGFVERGERQLRHEEVAAAWNDLLQAEQVGPAPGAAGLRQAFLRQALTRLGLGEARALLEAGEPGRAAEVLGQLRERGVRQPEGQQLAEAAKAWGLARDLAGRGEFTQALQAVDQVRRILPGPPPSLERFQKELEGRQENFTALLLRLHEAAGEAQWREVLPLSDQVLALAPQHEPARKARARAWRAIEPDTCTFLHPGVAKPSAPTGGPEPARLPQRYLLWIDGVGGYLVCLGNRVTVGQACSDNYVDIALFADVSRLHATLTRDSEGYLLEAVRSVSVNGQAQDKTWLQSGDRVTLGGNCQFQFQQPVPVSASARLDLLSGHRLPVAVEGVLLMADTLVLGAGAQVHVTVPDLEQTVVLYRHPKGLGVRHAGQLTVDGQRCTERGLLQWNSIVTGDTFSLALEPVASEPGRT